MAKFVAVDLTGDLDLALARDGDSLLANLVGARVDVRALGRCVHTSRIIALNFLDTVLVAILSGNR